MSPSQTTTIDFEREFGVNAAYVETLYERWRQDPTRVEPEWRSWFERLANGSSNDAAAAGATVAPVAPAQAAPDRTDSAPPPAAPAKPIAPAMDATRERLKGIARKIAENMIDSLTVPTATSVRTVPVKVLTENRSILNNHMKVRALGKASFTHLIAFALVRALKAQPQMQAFYDDGDDGDDGDKGAEGPERKDGGGPFKVTPAHVNLGLAIDVETSSGRTLLVPNVKRAETLGFTEFREAYEDLVRRGREGKLAASDFAGTTVTLTNPGGLGTHMSVPRLMRGQGLIIGTGSIGLPTHAAAMSLATLGDLAIGPELTITSTYDHRVIQGAESGILLKRIDDLLCGEDEFYDEIFRAMRVPWQPVRAAVDTRPAHGRASEEDHVAKQARVNKLINAYRSRGCRIADLDPLEYTPDHLPSLDPSDYGFTIWDLDREFVCDGLVGKTSMPLRDILSVLANTYCRRWTIEYMHITNRERKHWIRDRVELKRDDEVFGLDDRERILKLLYRAENFERFLHTRYVGNKRFSLEGADTLIPALAELIDRAVGAGVEKVVIGMAHRGRLNVLANILNKSYDRIFREFEGVLLPISTEGSGDVKYHLGQTGVFTTRGGKQIDVILSANPSHLEAVDPVVCGMTRGYQDALGDADRTRVLSVLIHGDAAFAGQGVVAETLNMSNLPANFCGGTIHLVVNNQIGFTAGPRDLRSTYYCTDLAKGIEAPILHANGDYPEAVLKSVHVAVDYQREFQRDVVIDMVCYRRWGHNEGDEPAYTQPVLYRRIQNHPTVTENYVRLLIRRGQLSREQAEEIGQRFNDELKDALDRSREPEEKQKELPLEEILDVTDDDPRDYAVEPSPETGVDAERLIAIVDECNTMPKDHTVHPNLLRQLRRRERMVRGEQDLDWGTAEAIAFGTLLQDGVPIRLNGQDSGRGTFSQRHSVIRDQASGADYVPLADLKDAKATFEVHDSFLSEEAALAFEFGYSVTRPRVLTIWEAQFGDFANGAQIPIDQFIVSSEAKWRQLSGVVLLLPHGYDGQGPEHSSGRIERFLTQCADGNMSVCNCSTAAQYFHLLRRQGVADPKRPLVVFTPKSLLRDPRAASPIHELTEGRFRELIADAAADPATTKRLLLCSGKLYHELAQHREEHGHDDVAIARLEQLYPFPRDQVRAEIERLSPDRVVWCQEEPKNMGPFSFVLQRGLDMGVDVAYAGRPVSASPATGSYKRHNAEQEYLVKKAFAET